jgi:hypothetical protein
MNGLYEPPGEEKLVEEYLQRPKGPHSPELQDFLKTLLGERASRNVIIVNLVPFRLWVLATLPEDRSLRVQIERDRPFDSEDDAERALFLRRLELRAAPNSNDRAGSAH